jgi:hypothetical protein
VRCHDIQPNDTRKSRLFSVCALCNQLNDTQQSDLLSVNVVIVLNVIILSVNQLSVVAPKMR